MKQLLYFSLLFFSLQGLAVGDFASTNKKQPAPGDTVEVFLSITHNDPLIYNAVLNELEGMSGITLVAYCNNHAVFMLLLKPGTYRDKTDVLNALKTNVPKFENELQLKEAEFKTFYVHCEPLDNKDAKNIKKYLQK